MFRRGRRLFSIASILLILTAVAHTLGHFQPEPRTPEFANLKSAMQAYQIDMMGIANIIGVGALIALYWFYRIPPPLISFVIVEIVFLLAVLIPDRKQA